MSAHLHPNQIEGFYDRRLETAEMIAVWERLDVCDDCQRLFRDVFRDKRQGAPVTLNHSPAIWFRNEHFDYETMAGYADETLDGELREVAELHLRMCGNCRRELQSLIAFRQATEAELKLRYGPNQTTRDWAWLSFLWNWPRINWKPAYIFAALILIGLAVAASVSIFKPARDRKSDGEILTGITPSPSASASPSPEVKEKNIAQSLTHELTPKSSSTGNGSKARLHIASRSVIRRAATPSAAVVDSMRTPEQIVRELGPVRDALPRRPRPEDKRVWASIKQSPEAITEQMFEEALRRDPNQTKKWVALVDGNEPQLELLKVAANEYGVELEIILDLIHVLEYLWKASWAFHNTGDRAAEAWVGERLAEILRGRSSLVAAGMRRSAYLRGLSAGKRAAVDDCADYLLKYRAFLHYDRYLAEGFPIATGVIEGACRYLVKDRMEITGARWGLDGAEAVLQLRSLRASGDFDEYWEFHLQLEYKRNHQARYENGQVPLPNPAPGSQTKAPHLRLVQ